ncbi:MAG: rhomboid family intramembrane serine protease [Chloroflexi bacterium]|nr:rhomboid family intramembrane serine protease [Chloroflexota bacterium]
MIPLRDANPTRRAPVVTLAVVALCVAAFGAQLVVMAQGGGAALEELFLEHGSVPAELVAVIGSGDILSEPVLDVFTSMFLHAGWLHLLGNLLFLWIFGINVEGRMGHARFLLVYLAGGVAATIAQVLVDPASEVPMIGASGAISAVLGAYLVLFPRARIQSLVFLGFFYQLVAVPAVIVLGFWFLLQVVDGIGALGATTGVDGGVAFFAHIGGFVAGALLALPFRLRGARVG